MGHRISLFLAILVSSSVVLGQIAFKVPSNTPICQSKAVQISWSGGTAPYKLGVIPGGSSSSQSYHAISASVAGTTVAWSVNIRAGTSVSFFIRDSKGATGTSGAFTIRASGDAACAATPPTPPPPTDPSKPASPDSPSTPTDQTTNPTESTPLAPTGSGSIPPGSTPSNSSPLNSPSGTTAKTSPTGKGKAIEDPTTGTDKQGDATKSSSHPNIGAIVGGVIAALIIILGLTAAFLWWWRRRQRRRRESLDLAQLRSAEPDPFMEDMPYDGISTNGYGAYSPPAPLTPNTFTSYEMATRSPSIPLHARTASPSISGLSYAATSTTGASELSPEQAAFVRDLYENGVAPSAVASIIQSMVQGSSGGVASGSSTPIPPVIYEKGVPVSNDRKQMPMNVANPFSDDLDAPAPPPRYSEM